MDDWSRFLENMDWASLGWLLLRLAAVLLCIMIHEISHGLAAYLLGDPTAKARHRLSLNPICHIDPLGTLMMLMVGFGWAKPVPVDARYFKHPKSGMAITALAGPLSNFVLAYVAYVLSYFFLGIAVTSDSLGGWSIAACEFCAMTAALSIGLGIFNLIPFPPLDGSKVVGAFLPEHIYFKILRYEFWGMIALMALLWSGWIDLPLYTAQQSVSRLLSILAQWPYQLMVG